MIGYRTERLGAYSAGMGLRPFMAEITITGAVAYLSNRADIKAEQQFLGGFYGKQRARDEEVRRRRELLATINPLITTVATAISAISAIAMLILTVMYH